MGPQTGMSEEPCAGASVRPWVTSSRTSSGENWPPLRAASIVRSAGGMLSDGAIGPLPVPSRLSVSNSLSSRHWKLNQTPAVRHPTHVVEVSAGHRLSVSSG